MLDDKNIRSISVEITNPRLLRNFFLMGQEGSDDTFLFDDEVTKICAALYKAQVRTICRDQIEHGEFPLVEDLPLDHLVVPKGFLINSLREGVSVSLLKRFSFIPHPFFPLPVKSYRKL